MGSELGLFSGRRLRLARPRRERESVDVVCAAVLQVCRQHLLITRIFDVAVDAERHCSQRVLWCAVALPEQTGVRPAGRITTTPDGLELFAKDPRWSHPPRRDSVVRRDVGYEG